MKKVIIAALTFAPVLASAQSLGNLETFIRSVGRLVNLALPIVVGIALLGFFWGLAKFIFSQGNEESKADGKKMMIWGIVALFVMVSVWGLVNFIGQAFNIQSGGSAPVPRVQGL